jgi:hypothetical protein
MRALIVVVLGLAVAAPCGGAREAKELQGVVVGVESQGLTRVTGFTLKDEGAVYDIAIDPGTDYGFPLDHLNEHKVTAAPVLVVVEERAGRLVALEIKDVSAGP